MYKERSLLSIKEAESLILNCGLNVNYETDYSMGIFDNGNLIASGSLVGNLIEMVVVAPDHRGKDLTSKIITNLVNHAFSLIIYNIYLNCCIDKISRFTPLGFKVVNYSTPSTALLHWGKSS